MAARLITSAVGIVLCIGLMFWGEVNPIVLTIAISLVTGLMCGELLSAKKLHKKYIISIPSILLGISMPVLSSTDFVFIPLYLFTVAVFVSAVLYHKDITADDMMFAFGGTLLVTLSMTAFAYTVCGDMGLYPLVKTEETLNNYPSFWIVLTLAVPWMADSGAYFAGRFLGKHKLCEAISPKKTIEGAVGGLISGFVASFLIGFIFIWIYKDVTINFIPLIAIGLINPVISIFGDLTFSIIKRSCNVKDYGSIMPGHGGMLDRFDSIILCAPLVFLVSQFITVIS
jgi:phosphatidate cytidylyltransferase